VNAPQRVPQHDEILLGENLDLLPQFADGSFQLIYLDPPFNTGTTQRRVMLQTVADEQGDRVGFNGRRYTSVPLSEQLYEDAFDDYLAFLEPRLRHAHRLLCEEGTLYFHIDYREAHYCKLLLDRIFGRECFLNEIVWAYDYGARSKRRWPAKHDTILVYVKQPRRYHFDSEAVDREPYMAPGLVSAEKAARGKLPTDVWWHTIVPTAGSEKTGYPTQKPLGVLRRIVLASSRPGDWCLDFFAGSGTLGVAAAQGGRGYVLIDSSPEAVAVMRRRLGAYAGSGEPEPAANGRGAGTIVRGTATGSGAGAIGSDGALPRRRR
jgi:site-specific DNA-methyltransferase (adenine-specific)